MLLLSTLRKTKRTCLMSLFGISAHILHHAFVVYACARTHARARTRTHMHARSRTHARTHAHKAQLSFPLISTLTSYRPSACRIDNGSIEWFDQIQVLKRVQFDAVVHLQRNRGVPLRLCVLKQLSD